MRDRSNYPRKLVTLVFTAGVAYYLQKNGIDLGTDSNGDQVGLSAVIAAVVAYLVPEG